MTYFKEGFISLFPNCHVFRGAIDPVTARRTDVADTHPPIIKLHTLKSYLLPLIKSHSSVIDSEEINSSSKNIPSSVRINSLCLPNSSGLLTRFVTKDLEEDCLFSLWVPHTNLLQTLIHGKVEGTPYSQKGATYVFQARWKSEADEWIFAINQAIEAGRMVVKKEAHLCPLSRWEE